MKFKNPRNTGSMKEEHIVKAERLAHYTGLEWCGTQRPEMNGNLKQIPPPFITTSSSSVAPKVPQKRKVGVPKFLRFLFEILNNEDSDIISWANDGTALQIFDTDAIAQYILPKYFKHAKYASFQRQLNYFGFRKWTKSQTNICTFSHPNFRQDYPEGLRLIKRKNAPETPRVKESPTNAKRSANDASFDQLDLIEKKIKFSFENPYGAFTKPPIKIQNDLKSNASPLLPHCIDTNVGFPGGNLFSPDDINFVGFNDVDDIDIGIDEGNCEWLLNSINTESDQSSLGNPFLSTQLEPKLLE